MEGNDQSVIVGETGDAAFDTASDTGAGARRGFWQRQLHPTADERARMHRAQAWVILGGAYALWVFAYAWPPDWENTSTVYALIAWTAFMIRTFILHGGLLLAVLVALAAWKRRWRLVVAALPLLVMTLGPAVLASLPRSATSAPADCTVMSVNLLMINRQTDPLIDEIAAVDPDVLLLQEYTDHWHAALQQRLGVAYPHIAYIPRDDSFGSAIYSRHAFVGKVQRYLPLGSGSEPQMRAVIQIGDAQIAVYNIHLLPPWGVAYILENRRQFADLHALLAAEELPLILAGDFNFTETGPNAAALAELGLRDAQSVAGRGRGATWPVHGLFRWVPGLRLDHIYARGDWRVLSCRCGYGAGSDHRPVIARLGLPAAR